jgi:PAS domain S-box-containing protein
MPRETEQAVPVQPVQIFTGGGELGRLMRAHDWSSTPLGPPDAWPPSLRVVVGIVLSSGYPMAVMWGPERTLLYNDAFCSVLGPTRHPAALGRPAPEALAEIWPVVGPLVDRALASVEDASDRGQPMLLNRAGHPEERYFDFSYSAVHDEDGGVGGVLLACSDVTSRVLAERRLGAQYAVSRILSESETLEEALASILPAVGHELGWDLTGYWAVDATTGELVRGDSWSSPTIDVSDFEAASRDRRFSRGRGLPGRVWATGQPAWIDDVRSDRDFPRGPAAAAVGLRSAFAFPIRARDEVFGIIECLARSAWRHDDALLQAVSLIGAQIGQFIERRQAASVRGRLAAIVESSGDAIIGKTLDGVITSWNPGATALYGYAPDEVLGRPISILMPPAQADELPGILARLRRGERIEPFETRRMDRRGRILDVSVTISPIVGSRGEIIGASAIARDISERTRTDLLLAGERRALQMVAQGASLASILASLCRTTEDLAGDGLLSSVLLLDADGIHLRHGAAPGLPDEYVRGIDGHAIGPLVGSCGTAAYRREMVVVEDIANDPLWVDFRDLALRHGLGSCWSTPIFGSSSQILGTFALYYREARAPRPEHLALIEAIARTAAIVIERKQIELALERSEERFRVALAPAPIIVAEQDTELRYTWIYDPTSRFSGRDALGRSDADLFPASVSAPLTRLKRRVIRTARGVRREVRTAVADDVSTYDLTVEPIVVDGAVVGITSVAVDVTRRKALEEQLGARRQQAEALARDRALERDRLQQVIDGLPEAVIIGTADGYFLMNNRMTTELLGIDLAGVRIPFGDEESLVARHTDGSPARGSEMPLQRSIRDGEVVRAEQWLCRGRPDGRDIPLLMSSAPLYDHAGTITGGVAVFQDISTLKDVEREKDDFLASAAHDLRNPLTSIKGYAELLRRHVARSEHPDRDRLERGLAQILVSGQRMSDLIDQVLDLTRFQMGRPLDLHPQPTDLVALIREIAAASDQMSEQHVVTVRCALPELVGVWDTARLERAVQNLVSNAIKFSPDGGEVTIRLEQESTTEGRVAVLTVRDHGLGIPADDVPRLFTRFYRAGNVVGKVSGTGLGLASVRQVVEGHGGTVAVESTLGEGSVFTLRLPLER